MVGDGILSGGKYARDVFAASFEQHGRVRQACQVTATTAAVLAVENAG